MDFAHYQPSKLLGSSLPIINWCTLNIQISIFGALSIPYRQIQYREYLGQTSGDSDPINIGKSETVGKK